VTGGSTVILRAIGLLRLLGYLRFDLFGSIAAGWRTRTTPTPSRRTRPTSGCGPGLPPGGPIGRVFEVSPWHLRRRRTSSVRPVSG